MHGIPDVLLLWRPLPFQAGPAMAMAECCCQKCLVSRLLSSRVSARKQEATPCQAALRGPSGRAATWRADAPSLSNWGQLGRHRDGVPASGEGSPAADLRWTQDTGVADRKSPFMSPTLVMALRAPWTWFLAST